MNKRNVNKYITYAYDALNESTLVENNEISKSCQSQLSAFGAAVTMGSLLPAIAFFSKKAGSQVDREELMVVIYKTLVIGKNKSNDQKEYTVSNFFDDVRENEYTKNDIIEAAVAVKLAMNLFKMKEEKKDKKDE